MTSRSFRCCCGCPGKRESSLCKRRNGAINTRWEWVGAGALHGLQNRWSRPCGLDGGFDSHALPPAFPGALRSPALSLCCGFHAELAAGPRANANQDGYPHVDFEYAMPVNGVLASLLQPDRWPCFRGTLLYGHTRACCQAAGDFRSGLRACLHMAETLGRENLSCCVTTALPRTGCNL